MIKKILFLLFLFAVSLQAGMVENLQAQAVNVFNALVNFFHSIRWVFAILPVFAAVMVLTKGIAKLKEEKTQQMQSMKPSFDDVSKLVFSVGAVFLSFFILYGIFAITFANANSMQEAWSVLVNSFWREIL